MGEALFESSARRDCGEDRFVAVGDFRGEFYMEVVENLKAKKRGRPKLEHPKVQVTLRLDADVVGVFKEDGPGWQGRINEELKKTVKRKRSRS
ncbi:MAG TPA: BrnA antitoxin family protein [Rhizomicrobium sp.]